MCLLSLCDCGNSAANCPFRAVCRVPFAFSPATVRVRPSPPSSSVGVVALSAVCGRVLADDNEVALLSLFKAAGGQAWTKCVDPRSPF